MSQSANYEVKHGTSAGGFKQRIDGKVQVSGKPDNIGFVTSAASALSYKGRSIESRASEVQGLQLSGQCFII